MEHIKAELERLYRRLNELDKEHERNKGIRHLLTMLLFIAAKTFILYATTAGNFILCLCVSVFFGTLEYWICFFIYAYHFNKCNEEHSHIEYIKKQIAELEKEQKKGR